MENLNLEQLLDQYMETVEQINALSEKKTAIGNMIKVMLANEPDKKYKENGYKASLTQKTTFTYNDETAIRNYITQKGLSDIYFEKKINTSKLNGELKSKGILYENLKEYFTENITEALSVSGGNKNE